MLRWARRGWGWLLQRKEQGGAGPAVAARAPVQVTLFNPLVDESPVADDGEEGAGGEDDDVDDGTSEEEDGQGDGDGDGDDDDDGENEDDLSNEGEGAGARSRRACGRAGRAPPNITSGAFAADSVFAAMAKAHDQLEQAVAEYNR